MDGQVSGPRVFVDNGRRALLGVRSVKLATVDDQLDLERWREAAAEWQGAVRSLTLIMADTAREFLALLDTARKGPAGRELRKAEAILARRERHLLVASRRVELADTAKCWERCGRVRRARQGRRR